MIHTFSLVCSDRCAYLLFVRPPGECPTCRQAIEQVVELTEVAVPIGQTSSVK